MNANKIAAITQLLVMTLGAALHAPCNAAPAKVSAGAETTAVRPFRAALYLLRS